MPDLDRYSRCMCVCVCRDTRICTAYLYILVNIEYVNIRKKIIFAQSTTVTLQGTLQCIGPSRGIRWIRCISEEHGVDMMSQSVYSVQPFRSMALHFFVALFCISPGEKPRRANTEQWDGREWIVFSHCQTIVSGQSPTAWGLVSVSMWFGSQKPIGTLNQSVV